MEAGNSSKNYWAKVPTTYQMVLIALVTSLGLTFLVLGCVLYDNFYPMIALVPLSLAAVPLLLFGVTGVPPRCPVVLRTFWRCAAPPPHTHPLAIEAQMPLLVKHRLVEH